MLLAVLDPAWLLGFDALTFALSAALIAGIHRPMHDASRRHAPLTVGLLFRDIGDGLHSLVRHDGVRTMTTVGFVQCLSLGGFMSLTVVWLDRMLGLGTEGWRFGVTYGAWAAGGLAASLALPRLVRSVTPARITLTAVPVAAALGVLVSRLQTWWLAAALMAVWAVASTLVMINSITYRQQVTPSTCSAGSTPRAGGSAGAWVGPGEPCSRACWSGRSGCGPPCWSSPAST